MEQLVTNSVGAPKGLLRVNATLGFGRSHVASLISDFAKLYPEVQVQLQLTVNPPPLTEDAFDICIRFGEPPEGTGDSEAHRGQPPSDLRGSFLPGPTGHAASAE